MGDTVKLCKCLNPTCGMFNHIEQRNCAYCGHVTDWEVATLREKLIDERVRVLHIVNTWIYEAQSSVDTRGRLRPARSGIADILIVLRDEIESVKIP